MSDTRALLGRITAFRERLERTPPLVLPADASPAIAALAARPDVLSAALRRMTGAAGGGDGPPPALTARARHLLEQARELIADQKRVSDDPVLAAPGADPLARFHRGTAALTEAALRTVYAFPDSADAQLRLCDGLEAMLGAVRDRLAVAAHAVAGRRAEAARVARLADLLAALAGGRPPAFEAFAQLADEVVDDARRGLPLGFRAADPADPPRFVAAASLATAAVVARVVPHDFEWAGRPVLAVSAALVMDVGMLAVPAGLLAKPGRLDPNERAVVERHPRTGAEMVLRLGPDAGPLADVVATHHERPDGTGYPHAAAAAAVPPLARLLAACGEYAGRASDRPHRPAADTRTALMDTLLAADQGRVDRDFAELLLHLSFHPVGTVVELADGRTAAVVATRGGRADLKATARPVVAVLTDRHGATLPRPEVVDLAVADVGGVARSLSTAERAAALADRYPDLC